MNIRLATPDDIAAIQSLEKQADTAAHWSDDIYRSVFMHGGAQRIAVVAEENGSTQAFIVSRVVGDEWEIENIVVEKSMRRRGIASALLQDVIERARAESACQILLEVRQSNVSARQFYAKVGFVECGRRQGYYHDPEEEAVCYGMELSRHTDRTAQM